MCFLTSFKWSEFRNNLIYFSSPPKKYKLVPHQARPIRPNPARNILGVVQLNQPRNVNNNLGPIIHSAPHVIQNNNHGIIEHEFTEENYTPDVYTPDVYTPDVTYDEIPRLPPIDEGRYKGMKNF